MNIAFKVVFFAMCLNFATGLMMEAIPVFQDGSDNPGGVFRGGLDFNETYNTAMANEMDSDLEGGNLFVSIRNTLNSIVDTVTLGWFSQIKNMMNQYLYGFILMFENIFSSSLGPTMSSLIFGTAKVILSILYGFIIINFFSDRKIMGGLGE